METHIKQPLTIRTNNLTQVLVAQVALLLLVVWPGALSSVLAPSSDARSP